MRSYKYESSLRRLLILPWTHSTQVVRRRKSEKCWGNYKQTIANSKEGKNGWQNPTPVISES